MVCHLSGQLTTCSHPTKQVFFTSIQIASHPASTLSHYSTAHIINELVKTNEKSIRLRFQPGTVYLPTTTMYTLCSNQVQYISQLPLCTHSVPTRYSISPNYHYVHTLFQPGTVYLPTTTMYTLCSNQVQYISQLPLCTHSVPTRYSISPNYHYVHTLFQPGTVYLPTTTMYTLCTTGPCNMSVY